MGNNLLDALKNAGLANEKKLKKVQNEKKQQLHRDLKRGDRPAATAAPEPAAPAINDDAKTQAIQNAGALRAQRLHDAYKNIAVANGAGRKKFYFQTPDGFIDCLMLSDVACALLERGKYAVIASENLDDFILVSRQSALAVEAIDKTRIAVLRRQEC